MHILTAACKLLAYYYYWLSLNGMNLHLMHAECACLHDNMEGT